MILFFQIAILKHIIETHDDVITDDAYPPNVRIQVDDDDSDNIPKSHADTIHRTKSQGSIDHHGFNFSLYEREDPGFLIVSAAYPDHVFTIFDVENTHRQIMPVNLAEISEQNLMYQIFHGYFRKKDKGVWLEWSRSRDIDHDAYWHNGTLEKVQVIASGLEIHATRKLIESDQLFTVQMIEGSNFIKFISNERCLTVSGYKNQNRNSYPLLFKHCDDSIEQEFAMISVMKAVCLLGMENLCGIDERDSVQKAEEIVERKKRSMTAQEKCDYCSPGKAFELKNRFK